MGSEWQERTSVLAPVLHKLATHSQFSGHSGKYFDNDRQRFSEHHTDVSDAIRVGTLLKLIHSHFSYPYLFT